MEVQEELDAPEWYDAQFTGCDAIVPQLNTMLTDVEDLPRINELAQSLQELKASGQLTKFKAVVSATQCETLDDVFDRIEKLPQYCFETKIRDKDALVRDELEFVLGGKDADLIYKHLNREAYAEDVLKQYGAETHALRHGQPRGFRPAARADLGTAAGADTGTADGDVKIQ